MLRTTAGDKSARPFCRLDSAPGPSKILDVETTATTNANRPKYWRTNLWIAFGVLFIGVALHGYFKSQGGHTFTIRSICLLPLIAAAYTLHAIAALFARTATSRVLLFLAVAALIACDIHNAREWSSAGKEAAFGQAALWMGEIALSIPSCLVIALLGVPDDTASKTSP